MPISYASPGLAPRAPRGQTWIEGPRRPWRRKTVNSRSDPVRAQRVKPAADLGHPGRVLGAGVLEKRAVVIDSTVDFAGLLVQHCEVVMRRRAARIGDGRAHQELHRHLGPAG